MRERLQKGITASTLKWIAVISMLIDHFGIAIYWQLEKHVYSTYEIFRYLGRIAFPIYCFLIVEGFFLTKNVWRYVGRCLVFAVLSEIPFDMAIYGQIWYPYSQNVYFTLVIGLCTLVLLDKVRGYDAFCVVKQLFVIGMGAAVAHVLKVDYRYLGVLFIVMFYYCRGMNKWHRDLVGAVAFSYEVTAPLAMIPIHFYNGERGMSLKYVFYLIYPVHLLLYGIIRMFIL
ncbi:MAG: conjugal transfer protein TraX [Lachnospiraceae bacterium]|nr:conjugal transfer protein TraX [Lachnospiraceae bacterium]